MDINNEIFTFVTTEREINYDKIEFVIILRSLVVKTTAITTARVGVLKGKLINK